MGFYECPACDYESDYQFNVKRHIAAKHENNDKVYLCPLKCGLCEEKCRDLNHIIRHLSDAHGVMCQEETLQFDNESVFKVWKESVEKQEHCLYTKPRGTREGKRSLKRIYKCFRDGYTSSKGKGIRRPRESIKIGGCCPSRMIATTQQDTGLVTVRYIRTHVGHTNYIDEVPVKKQSRTRKQDREAKSKRQKEGLPRKKNVGKTKEDNIDKLENINNRLPPPLNKLARNSRQNKSKKFDGIASIKITPLMEQVSNRSQDQVEEITARVITDISRNQQKLVIVDQDFNYSESNPDSPLPLSEEELAVNQVEPPAITVEVTTHPESIADFDIAYHHLELQLNEILAVLNVTRLVSHVQIVSDLLNEAMSRVRGDDLFDVVELSGPPLSRASSNQVQEIVLKGNQGQEIVLKGNFTCE